MLPLTQCYCTFGFFTPFCKLQRQSRDGMQSRQGVVWILACTALINWHKPGLLPHKQALRADNGISHPQRLNLSPNLIWTSHNILAYHKNWPKLTKHLNWIYHKTNPENPIENLTWHNKNKQTKKRRRKTPILSLSQNLTWTFQKTNQNLPKPGSWPYHKTWSELTMSKLFQGWIQNESFFFDSI